MISVASASFSSLSTTARSAWYPGVTAPCAMCSRARLRNVWMSERNAPAMLRLRFRRFGLGRGAAGRGGLLRLTLGLVALDPCLLHARVLGFALLLLAFLPGDVVGGLGLRLGHLVLRLRRVLVVLGVQLGLGDLF